MSRVAAGSTTAMSMPAAAHVVSGELRHPRADATPLKVRIDPDDVDHAHPFMEGKGHLG
jgi:hypothetical protein